MGEPQSGQIRLITSSGFAAKHRCENAETFSELGHLVLWDRTDLTETVNQKLILPFSGTVPARAVDFNPFSEEIA